MRKNRTSNEHLAPLLKKTGTFLSIETLINQGPPRFLRNIRLAMSFFL